MYCDSDMTKLLQRYVGRQVTVQTHGYSRIYGQLASVHDSCIRLRNVIRLQELEDSRWYGEIERQQQEELNAGDAETLIVTHSITSISCADDPGPIDPDLEDNGLSVKELSEAAEEQLTAAESAETVANLFIGAGLTAGLAGGAIDLKRVPALRRDIRERLGFTIPKIRVRDDFRLGSGGYRFLVGGAECASGEVQVGKLLALGHPEPAEFGEPTVEPAFGMPAAWISPQQQQAAEASGFTVVDVWTVIITHLTEVVHRTAAALLCYNETTSLVRELANSEPALVSDHFGDPEAVMRLHGVLVALLEDGISIVHMERIASAVANNKRLADGKLLRRVRIALIHHLQVRLADGERRVRAALVCEPLQQRIVEGGISVSSRTVNALVERLERISDEFEDADGRLAVVVDEKNFDALRRSLLSPQQRWMVVSEEEAKLLQHLEFVAEIGTDLTPDLLAQPATATTPPAKPR